MDRKTMELLESIKRNATIGAETAEETPRFPCKRCDGRGFIFIRREGYGIGIPVECPDCKAARDRAAMAERSGITAENYAKFTLARFRADTPDARRMKFTAMQYLKERPEQKGAAFLGKSGTGKTHISIALLQALDRPHTYWGYGQKIQILKATRYRDFDRFTAETKAAAKAPNLYIDDLFQGDYNGGELDKQAAQIMFDIINTRYINRLPTFFSSNMALGDIIKANEAIGSRIYEMTAPYCVNLGEGALNVRMSS